MRRLPFRTPFAWLAALAAVTISCNDSPTGPSRNAPDGSIALSDSVFTRGQVVQARVGAPAGYSVVPGTVTWTVVAGGATLTDVGAGDTVDVALTGAGSVQLRVSYTLRSLGVGSSLTVAGPTRRPGGDVGVEGVRTMLVAAPLLDYTTLPTSSVTAGATLGNVQVALKDSRGRVLTTANDSIVIGLDPTSGAPGATLLGTLRARPTNGVATFAGMSIQKAGVGYRLIASSPTVASRDTATTTVVAGAPTAAQSTLAVADTIRSVGQTTTVTVTLRDEYGNPVLTATPASFTPSASTGTLGAFTCANGICTATYTAPNTPGTPVIGATIGGTQITGGPKTITVTPGPAAKLVITGLNAQTAGTAQNITITAYDAFGNVATSYTGAKDLTFSGASVAPNGTTQPTVSAASFAATAGITFVNGVATNVPMVLYKVETATISVSDGTIATTGSDRLPVTVTAAVPSPTTVGGGASGVTSSLSISRDTVALGETLTVTVRLFDLYGNPIVTATPSAFVATPSAGTLGAFTCVDGVCTATYTAPNTPGAPTIGVTIGGTPVGGSPKTVQVVDRTPPTITGPSGAAGAAASAKSVAENTTAVHTFTANEPVLWSLATTGDGAKFAIDPATGALTFIAPPDFEAPTDGDNNNTYLVTVRATDAAGNISTQTLTVTVTNVDDTGPAITGPSGTAGAAASAKSVAENTTAVHVFVADEAVTWSLDGGDDAAKFTINATTGALTFVSAPDFETPTDVGANNTYVVVVKATDAAGNVSTQTLTVTVTNVDDTAPVITGPSGGAGATSSAKSVAENTTAVHSFAATDAGAVTWSLSGGEDAAKFAIDPATGVLPFMAPTDFEQPPDGATSGTNTYVVMVRETDAAGNVSTQTLTVTVTNVDDAGRLVITGTATMVAGTSQTITITARDAAGNVETAYTGSKTLTFTGASLAPNGTSAPTVASTNFGTGTTLTFANGVATATMALYTAETAIVATTDGTISAAGADRLTVVVSADNASPVVSTLQASPATITADGVATSLLTLQLKDAYGNITSNVASPGTVVLVQSAGTGSLLGSLSNQGGGVYTQEVLSAGSAGSGTFKVSINTVVGTESAVVTYVAAGGPLSRLVCVTSQPAGQSAASSTTVALCGSTAPGDLEIVTLALDGVDDVVAPTAITDGTWVKISSVLQSTGSGGNKAMLLVNYARRYAAGLSRSVTFTAATNHKWSVDMVTFVSSGTGVPNGGDIVASQNATGAGLSSPGLTATAANTVVYYVMANSLTGNAATPTPNGLTVLGNNNSGGTSSASFFELLANNGDVAQVRTWTNTKSANTVLLQVLVRP